MIYTSVIDLGMKKNKIKVSHRAKKLYDLLLSVNRAVCGICYDFLT